LDSKGGTREKRKGEWIVQRKERVTPKERSLGSS